MAFLGFGKKEEVKKDEVKKTPAVKAEAKTESKTEAKPKKKAVVVSNTPSQAEYSQVLLRPRITEKAAIVAEKGVYTFDIDPRATKQEVEKAIEKTYKVKPLKVNISNRRQKMVFSRGKVGFKAGGKKAMVYLKEGDKIEFV
jgi:large subunit ribosomal protein L23